MKTSSSREQLLPVTQEKDHKEKRMQGKGIAAALGYMGCAGRTPVGASATDSKKRRCNLHRELSRMHL